MAKRKTNDILTLIVDDHHRIIDLIGEIEEDDNFESMYEAFNEVYKELTLHSEAEQIVFYPAMREFEQTEEYIEGAEEEHEDVAVLLEEAKVSKPGSEDFMDKLTQIRAKFEQHCEEEESEMFDAVQECMDEAMLVNLGQEFEQAKTKLQPDVMAALSE